MNDTEYLNSIEGMVELIIKEANTSYEDATNADDLDW